jgi:hypothetical protein
MGAVESPTTHCVLVLSTAVLPVKVYFRSQIVVGNALLPWLTNHASKNLCRREYLDYNIIVCVLPAAFTRPNVYCIHSKHEQRDKIIVSNIYLFFFLSSSYVITESI